MKVFAIASAKGGSGKSTTATALAVRAAVDADYVCLIDTNADQGSASQWWAVRGRPENPTMYSDFDRLLIGVMDLAKNGCDYLFIDTPPMEIEIIEAVVEVSDAVIIPVKASAFDVAAIDPVLELATHYNKPFAFLMTMIDPAMGKVINESVRTLASLGPVFKARMSYHPAYVSAIGSGKTGLETEKTLRPEIDAIWKEVLALSDSGRPIRGGRNVRGR